MNTKNKAEEVFWNLYIINRNGNPFKAFIDEAEANLVFSDLKQDDRSARYEINSIRSDMIHFSAPVGTTMNSNLGTKYVAVYSPEKSDTYFVKVNA